MKSIHQSALTEQAFWLTFVAGYTYINKIAGLSLIMLTIYIFRNAHNIKETVFILFVSHNGWPTPTMSNPNGLLS